VYGVGLLILAFDEKPPDRRFPLRRHGLAQHSLLLHHRNESARGNHSGLLARLFAEPEMPDDGAALMLPLNGTEGKPLQGLRPIRKPDGAWSLPSCDRQAEHGMTNANIFMDVDLTLVDAEGRLLDGAREKLQSSKDSDCHLYSLIYCRYRVRTQGCQAARPGSLIRGVQRQAGHRHRGYAVYHRRALRICSSDGASWEPVTQEIIERQVD
jgi:hypothetical protein